MRNAIYRHDLSSGVSEELPLKGLRGAVALDFDYESNCLYWADVTLDIIQVCIGQVWNWSWGVGGTVCPERKWLEKQFKPDFMAHLGWLQTFFDTPCDGII